MEIYNPATINGAKILVIDDIPNNLNLLANILKQKGYEVRLAPNGNLGLINVERFCPDLILLDIKMPGLNGYQVCQQLKENEKTRHIPVIFLSALDDAFDKTHAFEVGGADYITKPFQAQEILVRIEHQLNLTRLYQQLIHQKEQVNKKNKQLEKEIKERRKAEKFAQAANQAKSEFLAYINHEMRTPLTSIIGLSKLLMTANDRISAKDQVKYLQTIYRNSENLIALINNVLNFSKIEAGKLELENKPLDLQELLQELKDMFWVNAEHKGIEFSCNCPAQLPEKTITDATKLRQVLINLISNAIKFTEEGYVKVKVKFCHSADPQRIFFSVEDTGAGIAPEEIEKLFQPYEQTRTGRQAQLGTGLGLSISRQFVELMGGTIQVESEVGKGTCFRFDIVVGDG